MTEKTQPTDDLQQRCAEVVEWQRTGVLPGNALRDYAAAHWAGRHDSLQMAERDTSAQAMQWIAQWGTPPAVAGEPVDRADAVNLARNALTQYDCAITKKGVRVLAEAVLSMDAALTTPQPTQAQAGAVAEWVKYDTTNRILIIKGQRYAEELFDHDAAYAKSNQAGAVPQLAAELGPDGKEWAKTEAGYAHVDAMLPRADGHSIGPYWYGWALRGAFVAGAEWQEARQIGGIKGGQHGAE